MSTTVSNINYDDCIVLFSNDHTGPSRDFRSRLFMSELKHHALKEKGAQVGFRTGDLNIDVNNMEAAKSIYFKDNKKYGLGDNDLHVEWVFWLASVVYLRSGQNRVAINTASAGAGDAILALIRKLANAQPGSFEELVALFISEKLLDTLTNSTGGTLMPTRSSWGTAAEFRFKDLQANPLIANASAIAGNSLNERASDAFEIITNTNFDFTLLLTLTVAGTANGVQIAQYINWNAITNPAGGTPANLLDVSTNNRYTDANAFINMRNFFNDYGNASASADVATQRAAQLVRTNLRDKIINDCLNAKQFSWKQDAFMLKRLFKSLKNVTVPLSNWFNKPVNDPNSATLSNEKYYRKSLDGTLWEKLPNGTEKCVDTSDATVLASLKEDDKCFGLGVEQQVTTAAGNNLTCSDYFKDCITNGSVNECKSFLSEPTFWNVAAKEVDTMIPELAHQTLKSFEFETYDEFSKQARRSFKMVQSWSEWLDACVTKGRLNTNEKQTISQNVKLQEYLNALVKKVNDNPAILNKDYYGDKPSDLSTVFKGTLLAKRGLTYEAVPKNTDVATVARLANLIQDSQRRAVINFGQNIHPSVKIVLSGGAPSLMQLKADLIQQQYNVLKTRLKQLNKDIAPNDEAQVKKLIDELRKKELKLNEFIVFAERYADLIQVFGQTDKETSLTIDHLEEFTKARDNYFTKVSRKQNSLMSILQAIADKVNDIDNKSTPKDRKTSAIQ